MTSRLSSGQTYSEALSRLAARARYFRKKKFPVTWDGRNQIIIEEPEDCILIPDSCGVSAIVRDDAPSIDGE